MTTLTTYRPGRMSIFDEMDKMMDTFFNAPASRASRYPAVDVTENDKSYRLELELPGYSKDDVEIKIDNNLLSISAEEKEEASSEEKDETRWIIRERSARRFARTFVLPREIDTESISAAFENGLLTLEIAKSPKAVPRKIDIR